MSVPQQWWHHRSCHRVYPHDHKNTRRGATQTHTHTYTHNTRVGHTFSGQRWDLATLVLCVLQRVRSKTKHITPGKWVENAFCAKRTHHLPGALRVPGAVWLQDKAHYTRQVGGMPLSSCVLVVASK